jgi:pyridoxine 5-phosphate synthase
VIVLGVNIDHVATLRNARGGKNPDPLLAAEVVYSSGAGQVVCHLREDRRHILDQDLMDLLSWGKLPINLEMAMTSEMQEKALAVLPQLITLVPERRLERTTEGGLSLDPELSQKIQGFHKLTSEKKIPLSLFLDPEMEVIKRGCDLGVEQIELHTGPYANSFVNGPDPYELERLIECSLYIASSGVRLAMGHGLDCVNLSPILSIPNLAEVNIGHSIISRSVFIGLSAAIGEIQEKLKP